MPIMIYTRIVGQRGSKAPIRYILRIQGPLSATVSKSCK
ncbi:hypothetical protein EYZ11_012089 [Aspergillus tanneri]|uniref:Uncharacterized protein n=1 Tax=Aspergillus tanneri TaxID=1220188 RepID=A0A4V3UMS8_9EURO|nr:hypothetical protein EYZ11_012089 [Aspergillus tanneri]